MRYSDIDNDYFAWICDLMCSRFPKGVSFNKLLYYLHNTEFIYVLPIDENRADNGINLRYRFSISYTRVEDADSCIHAPCSVLEMMVALAFKMEETMDDPLMGDRTAQWFWNMVVSLGLGSMNDDRFDGKYVEETIERFLYRRYDSDGKGGLFTIRGCPDDLRDIDIWTQMCMYLNTIV